MPSAPDAAERPAGSFPWKPLLAVTVVSGFAIGIVGPDHVALQLARDAEDFRATLDSPGRQLAAAFVDVVYAASYGTLGVGALRMLGGRGIVTTLGVVAIAVGASCDEVENALLTANIVRHRTVTDGWIDAMQVPGALKWVSLAGFAVLLVLVVRSLLTRRAARG